MAIRAQMVGESGALEILQKEKSAPRINPGTLLELLL
jgi:hypothetical protein